MSMSRCSSRRPAWTRVSKQDRIQRSMRWFSKSSILLIDQPVASSTSRSSTVVTEAPPEILPSHNESQKWDATKRFNSWMDAFLARVATASHEINKYTGTDYSGIERLRQEIQDQEALVKERHALVIVAKSAFDDAQAQQMKSQKEVVGLLERKNNWANEDLERYMSLVRSEHINEQAVLVTRETLLSGEKALEDARTRLEQRERRRYHEEQIWSDTIRRNSTWITFGLMGFNALLLLLSIGVVEPWRRKRMVGEIKDAVSKDRGIKDVAVASGTEPYATGTDQTPLPATTVITAVTDNDVFLAASNLKPLDGDLADAAVQDTIHKRPQSTDASKSTERTRSPEWGPIKRAWNQSSHLTSDLFSKRLVSIRMVDITLLAVESAAAGAGIAALLIVLLRTR